MVPDPCVLVDPPDPYPGTLSVLARQSRIEEINDLQRKRHRRVWRVRESSPITFRSLVTAMPFCSASHYHNFHLERSPLTIYLHSGGDRVIFYDLVADSGGRLEYIEVRVEAELPSDAMVLARKPLNALLDNFSVTPPNMPLLLQRLDLISPRDGMVLLHELILPFRGGIRMGPLGGIWDRTPFAPYHAIFREAITSASPFYRLLCACRLYEGINRIRRWLREQSQALNLQVNLPADVAVDLNELLRLGFVPDYVQGIRTAADLFARMRDARDAIAHFLIERDDVDVHVYLADGGQLRTYSIGAAALLKYASLSLDGLRKFYAAHLEQHLMRGSILPTLELRDRFNVRG